MARGGKGKKGPNKSGASMWILLFQVLKKGAPVGEPFRDTLFFAALGWFIKNPTLGKVGLGHIGLGGVVGVLVARPMTETVGALIVTVLEMLRYG